MTQRIPSIADPSVRFMNVSFAYSSAPVVHQVDIEFVRGCIHCIIGPNGSGKSTLASLLIGMLVPQSGDIQINGRSLRGISEAERSRLVALTPQRISCPFDYSVLEFVRMARHGAGRADPDGRRLSDNEIIQSAMHRAGVVHLTGRPFNELSVGEQQRVAIARMLAQDTPIVVLDEPTSALDIEHQLELIALAQDIKQQGGCVIWITHDLHLALRIADTVGILQAGQVAAIGPPAVALADDVLDKVFGVRRGRDPQPQFVLRPKSSEQHGVLSQ